MYPEEGTRTHAIWEYIKQNTVQNGGQAPSIRDFIRDGVDNITSTSIVDYHLDKLVAAGLVYRHYGDLTRSRNISIVGSLYVLPENVQQNKDIQDFVSTFYPASVDHFLKLHTDALPKDKSKILIATDDTNIQLVAMGLGYGGIISPTVFDEEKEEDAEEDTRVPA